MQEQRPASWILVTEGQGCLCTLKVDLDWFALLRYELFTVNHTEVN